MVISTVPGLDMGAFNQDGVIEEAKENPSPRKDNTAPQMSPRSPLSPQSPQSDSIDLAIPGVIDISIDQLYRNVCEMQSSVYSPSRPSLGSYSEESRIDSELRHLVGDIEELELQNVVPKTKEKGHGGASNPVKEIVSNAKKSKKLENYNLACSWTGSHLKVHSKLATSSPKGETSRKDGEWNERNPKKKNPTFSVKNTTSSLTKFQDADRDATKLGLDDPLLGLIFLKESRDIFSSGENPQKALKLALQAVKSFQLCANGKPNLQLVMSLHVLAAIYYSRGEHDKAISILERSITIPVIEDGQDQALAKFAGCMQLGDTYAMMGQVENSILCYTAGLEIQRQMFGETDYRVSEICRYLAEAHVQALQFDEAEKLCQLSLDIHRENGSTDSLEEAADRRLIGLICDAKGNHEAAIEHYALASMALASNGQDVEVALIDCSIGDAYLSLARYDEAMFSFRKSLTSFKSAKGGQHPAVASVYVRLANLSSKTGKFQESKSYCENAQRIYSKPTMSAPLEEVASGLIDIAAIYQSMNELKKALKLLKKALKIYGNAPGQQSTIAGIESQIGIMYYMMGNYCDSYITIKSAILKFRECGEKKSAPFGVALNQLGLACIRLYAIHEAADLFEQARAVLEKEYGYAHPNTLGVLSNLSGTYDAMGRLDDAIEILEYVISIKEEKLGTANPDVGIEKQRLAELLREAKRARNKKTRPLESLLDSLPAAITENGMKII